MYVWVDALTNYLTGVGYPDTDSEQFQQVLAGEPAHHRQGHHPVPHRLLAGVPDVGGHRTAEARLRPRLPLQQGREDVEVGRQRRRPRRAWWSSTASTPCASSCSARSPTARTAATATRPSSTRINADLANELGNLAQRSLSMVAKNCDAPGPDPRRVHRGRRGDAGAGGCAARAGAAPNSTCRHCISRWRRSGRFSARPTGTSPSRSRGCCGRPIRTRMATVLYVTLEVVRIVGDPRPAGDAGRRQRRSSTCSARRPMRGSSATFRRASWRAPRCRRRRACSRDTWRTDPCGVA